MKIDFNTDKLKKKLCCSDFYSKSCDLCVDSGASVRSCTLPNREFECDENDPISEQLVEELEDPHALRFFRRAAITMFPLIGVPRVSSSGVLSDGP